MSSILNTTGVQSIWPAALITDTTGAGTATGVTSVNAITASTITSTAARTYSSVASLSILGAPTFGTNATGLAVAPALYPSAALLLSNASTVSTALLLTGASAAPTTTSMIDFTSNGTAAPWVDATGSVHFPNATAGAAWRVTNNAAATALSVATDGTGAVSTLHNTLDTALGAASISGTLAVGNTATTASVVASGYASNNAYRYSAGTAYQVALTVTGVGTAWNTALVGGLFVIAGGTPSIITNVTSTTTLSVGISRTVASAGAPVTYTIYYGGVQMDAAGTASIVTLNVNSLSSNIITPACIASDTQYMQLASVSQTATAITSASASLTAGMVGGLVVFATGQTALITAITSTTTALTDKSQTVAATSAIIYYGGFQLDSTGACYAQRLNTNSIITAGMNYMGYGIVGGTSTSSGATTAAQSASTVTASAAVFTSSMVAGMIVWATGQTAIIADYITATSVLTDVTQSVASATFAVYYNGHVMAPGGGTGALFAAIQRALIPTSLGVASTDAVTCSAGARGMLMQVGGTTVTNTNATPSTVSTLVDVSAGVIASSVATTYANVTTMLVTGTPTAGTNTTITAAGTASNLWPSSQLYIANTDSGASASVKFATNAALAMNAPAIDFTANGALAPWMCHNGNVHYTPAAAAGATWRVLDHTGGVGVNGTVVLSAAGDGTFKVLTKNTVVDDGTGGSIVRYLAVAAPTVAATTTAYPLTVGAGTVSTASPAPYGNFTVAGASKINTSGNYNYSIRCDGSILVAGTGQSIQVASDLRLKRNIRTVAATWTAAVMRTRVCAWESRDPSVAGTNVGFVAQEVADNEPAAVGAQPGWLPSICAWCATSDRTANTSGAATRCMLRLPTGVRTEVAEHLAVCASPGATMYHVTVTSVVGVWVGVTAKTCLPDARADGMLWVHGVWDTAVLSVDRDRLFVACFAQVQELTARVAALEQQIRLRSRP